MVSSYANFLEHKKFFVHQYGRRGVKSISIRRIQIVL